MRNTAIRHSIGILAYYARGRGYDSRTVQTFVCMNMSVCIESECFHVCIFNPLSRIHNTSLISAYFGLDSRECKCLEYLFIYYIGVSS
jgi:hypothetical protein